MDESGKKPLGRLTTRRVFVSYLGIATAAALVPGLSGCSMGQALQDTFGDETEPSNQPSNPSGQSVEASPFPTARLAVISDIHIAGDFEEALQHTRAAFQAIMQFDPPPDAIIINGDIANHGFEEEYDLLQQLAAETGFAFPDDFILTMGDHEQWGHIPYGAEPDYPGQREVFLRRCGLDSLYYDRSVNGEHLIMLGPDEDPATWPAMKMSEAQLAWLDQQLAADDQQGLRSFVFLHEPPNDTVPYTFEGEIKHGANESSDAFRAVVDKYRNAIVFSGHTHSPVAFNRPLENGPLYVADGAVAYLRDDAYTDERTEAGSAQSRGLLADIYSDRVEFLAWDFVAATPLDSYRA